MATLRVRSEPLYPLTRIDLSSTDFWPMSMCLRCGRPVMRTERVTALRIPGERSVRWPWFSVVTLMMFAAWWMSLPAVWRSGLTPIFTLCVLVAWRCGIICIEVMASRMQRVQLPACRRCQDDVATRANVDEALSHLLRMAVICTVIALVGHGHAWNGVCAVMVLLLVVTRLFLGAWIDNRWTLEWRGQRWVLVIPQSWKTRMTQRRDAPVMPVSGSA